MRKIIIFGVALIVFFAGCNLRVERWNENKVLPLNIALPLDTDTFTVEEFVQRNRAYLSTLGDTIFYGQCMTFTNLFLAVDSTVCVNFSRALPEDIVDTLKTVLNSEVCEIRGLMRFKGTVYSDLSMKFSVSYYKGSTEIRRDSTIYTFHGGYHDTTVYLTLRNVPIGSFSVNLSGVGGTGVALVDSLELSYSIPVIVNFRGDTVVFKEVVFEIDSSIIEMSNKEIPDTIEFGINVWNRIPMGFILNVWALDKEKDDSIAVISADVPQALISNGFAQSESRGFFNVKLGASFREFLRKDTVYFHISAIVPPNNEIVKFRPQDYLRYNSYIRIWGYLNFKELFEE